MADALEARLARIADKPACVLTHLGRKTGTPHQVMIWFVVDGDRMLLQTINLKRQWVRNLLANPKVSIKIGEERFEGAASPITDPAALQRAAELMRRKYPIMIPYLWFRSRPVGAFEVRLLR